MYIAAAHGPANLTLLLRQNKNQDCFMTPGGAKLFHQAGRIFFSFFFSVDIEHISYKSVAYYSICMQYAQCLRKKKRKK